MYWYSNITPYVPFVLEVEVGKGLHNENHSVELHFLFLPCLDTCQLNWSQLRDSYCLENVVEVLINPTLDIAQRWQRSVCKVCDGVSSLYRYTLES